MGFFGEMFGGGERCAHGTPKGEYCKQCEFEAGRDSVIESLKELMCPHGKDYRECEECEKTGWRPGDKKE